MSVLRSRLTTSLVTQGVPKDQATKEAASAAQLQGSSGSTASIPHFFRLDFAYATRSVLYGMALVMAVGAVIGLVGLRRGLQEDPEGPEAGTGPDPVVEGTREPAIPPTAPGH